MGWVNRLWKLGRIVVRNADLLTHRLARGLRIELRRNVVITAGCETSRIRKGKILMIGTIERTSESAQEVEERSDRSEAKNTRLARYRSLAQENMQREKFDAAQRCLEKAVYIAVRTYGPTHLEVGVNLLELGSVLHKRGFVEAAEPLMARARRILRAAGN
jgi:hypothetical protein